MRRDSDATFMAITRRLISPSRRAIFVDDKAGGDALVLGEPHTFIEALDAHDCHDAEASQVRYKHCRSCYARGEAMMGRLRV